MTYSSDHRHTCGVEEGSSHPASARYYFHGIVEDIILLATDLPEGMVVEDWDDFGVRVELGTTNDATVTRQQHMVSHLLSGMAYVSATYHRLTPTIESAHAILSINIRPPSSDGSYKVGPGSKLLIEFNSGKHWAVYSDGPIEFRFEATRHHRLVATTATPTCGAPTIRVAKIHVNPSNNSNAHETKILDECATRVFLGGTVEIRSDKTYNLTWKTMGEGPFLHYALQHHILSFVGEPPKHYTSIVAESSTRGTMYRIRDSSGSDTIDVNITWELKEPDATPIRFDPSQSIDPNLVKEFKIDKHIFDEIGQAWTIPRDGSYYFNGKKMQLYASLCLMVHYDALTKDKDLRQSCIEKFAKLWDLFLSTDSEEGMLHPLVYDEVYKGIVSSEGFHRKDIGADFGNTVYNHHHYHYGYWIVAASVFLYLHPDYPQRDLLKGRIETLIRDVANPNLEDPYFLKFRHFDWYLGHSYSHGVTPMGDGKDQESASEEMNFHYGLALWGKVTTGSKLEALGELMLKVNARAIQTYLFMTTPKSLEKDNDNANQNYSAPPIEAIVHPS